MSRWNTCNILDIAPDAKRLWRFEAKGNGFVLGREQRVPHASPLPAKLVSKSWGSLFQPQLNVAWLPPESVFLRVPSGQFPPPLHVADDIQLPVGGVELEAQAVLADILRSNA